VSRSGKILVARLGAIGDICMLMPIVQALSHHFEVDWLIRERHAPLAQRFPELACRLVPAQVGRDEGAPFSPDLVKRLADGGYDCLLDFSHWTVITWLAERLPGIPIRAVTVDPPQDRLLGIPVDPERQGRAFNCLVPVSSALHQHDKWCALVKAALGVEVEPEWALPARPPIDRDRPLRIFLQPHASKPEKLWRAKNFAAVIAGLARRRRIQCIVNLAERKIARELRWRLLFSRAEMEYAALDPSFMRLQAALENSDIALGCDSGPMHFASLSGVPSLVIYGRYPAAEFGPRWRSVAVSPPDPGLPADCIPVSSVAAALDRLVDKLTAAP
jgi:ADP-heptose:LPS heptosyltransferase